MTKSLNFYIILVVTIVLYLFIFLFNIYIYIYIYIYIIYVFLGGLPLYGVYDSFVDYPHDDVVYCH